MSKTVVIAGIRDKVRVLMDENVRLRRELGYNLSVLEVERTRVRELRGEIAELKKRVARLELGGGLGDGKAARARLGRLIREVDKCIELVSK